MSFLYNNTMNMFVLEFMFLYWEIDIFFVLELLFVH